MTTRKVITISSLFTGDQIITRNPTVNSEGNSIDVIMLLFLLQNLGVVGERPSISNAGDIVFNYKNGDMCDGDRKFQSIITITCDKQAKVPHFCSFAARSG